MDYRSANAVKVSPPSMYRGEVGEPKKCEERAASELMADLMNTVAAQERALRSVEDLGVKIFGPTPEAKEANEIHPEHLTAMIARSRRLATEIADRLEGINSNV